MTDFQFRIVLKMIIQIIKDAESKEEIIKKIEDLLEKQNFKKILKVDSSLTLVIPYYRCRNRCRNLGYLKILNECFKTTGESRTDTIIKNI